ncbi:MAG: hypothetical protein JWR51_3725 [Devosia sp.]|nr:hypothetical protein [Devosia sp.]
MSLAFPPSWFEARKSSHLTMRPQSDRETLDSPHGEVGAERPSNHEGDAHQTLRKS